MCNVLKYSKTWWNYDNKLFYRNRHGTEQCPRTSKSVYCALLIHVHRSHNLQGVPLKGNTQDGIRQFAPSMIGVTTVVSEDANPQCKEFRHDKERIRSLICINRYKSIVVQTRSIAHLFPLTSRSTHFRCSKFAHRTSDLVHVLKTLLQSVATIKTYANMQELYPMYINLTSSPCRSCFTFRNRIKENGA